jgi:hypothetical protein
MYSLHDKYSIAISYVIVQRCSLLFDIQLLLQSRVAKSNEQLETEKLELLALLERKRQEIEGLNGKQYCT